MRKLCYIDTETTGLNSRTNAVIQIAGIIEINGERMEDFNFTVAPHEDAEFNLKAFQTNGKSVEEIITYAPAGTVREELEKIFRQYVDPFTKTDKFVLVGYNAPFDYDFMNSFWYKSGSKFFGSYFWKWPLDVRQLALQCIAGHLPKLDGTRQTHLAPLFGVNLTEEAAHDAMADIEATYQIHKRIEEHGIVNFPLSFPDIEQDSPF